MRGRPVKKFTGRNAELKYLNQYYEKDGSQLLIVYGSKGVGKTRLLQEFCKDKKWCYLIETVGWNITYTDGLHPDANGGLVAGENIALEIKKVLGENYFLV